MCARRARGWIALSGVLLSGALLGSCSLVSGFDDLVFDLGGPAAGGKPSGTPCARHEECEANQCQDGVCCDLHCDECGQCNLPGSVGRCVYDPVGPDPGGGCQDGVCDGTGSCARGTHSWSYRFGDASPQQVRAVATGPGGAIVITGSFDGNLDFGPGLVISSGGSDVFWATLDRDGHAFSAAVLTNGDSYADASAVALDDDGNVFLAVDFASTFPGLPGTYAAIDSDGAVLKITAAGIEWATPFGGTGVQRIGGIALDDDGNVFVTGRYDWHLFVSELERVPTSGVGLPNVFVTKLRADGEHLWSKGFGDENDQSGLGIDVSGDSTMANVAISGATKGILDLGVDPLSTDLSYFASYAASLDQDGNAAWALAFGSGDSGPRNVLFGVDGEVVVAGGASGPLGLGESGEAMGGTDAFVARFAADGTPLFGGIYGGPGAEDAPGLAVTQNGHMVLAGSFDSQIGFGGPVLDTVGGSDVFVAKISRYGQHLWSYKFGFDDDQKATAAAINEGRVIVVGDFAGIVDFGGTLETQLESAGGTDIFVAAFEP